MWGGECHSHLVTDRLQHFDFNDPSITQRKVWKISLFCYLYPHTSTLVLCWFWRPLWTKAELQHIWCTKSGRRWVGLTSRCRLQASQCSFSWQSELKWDTISWFPSQDYLLSNAAALSTCWLCDLSFAPALWLSFKEDVLCKPAFWVISFPSFSSEVPLSVCLSACWQAA